MADEARLLAQIGGLVQELAELRLRNVHHQNGRAPRARAPSQPARTMAIGDRVLITRRDEYLGRQGVLISPQGRLFWNIKLDKLTNKPSIIIHKKENGLQLLPPQEQGGE